MTYLNKLIIRKPNKVLFLVIKCLGGAITPIYFILLAVLIIYFNIIFYSRPFKSLYFKNLYMQIYWTKLRNITFVAKIKIYSELLYFLIAAFATNISRHKCVGIWALTTWSNRL